jgi:hypothetical protein
MLAALCLAMVFAISLSSYIALCYVSLSMSTRSIMSSHSMELAEAGMEQALYAQNNSDWSGWTATAGYPSSTFTTEATQMTMTARGLKPTGGSPTPLIFGNGATGLVNVSVQYYTATGVIFQIKSQGQMSLPNGTASSSTSVTQVSRTLTYSSGAPSTGTNAAPVFVNAVAATTGRVQFKAAGTVDSYNSNPSPGTFQNYSASVAGWSGVVLSQDVTSSTATVILADAVVNGYAAGYVAGSTPSSPYWLSYGKTGEIVGKNPGSTLIDSSRLFTNPAPYQPILPENLPNGTQNLPLASCVGGTNVLSVTSTLGSTTSPYPVYYASGINLAAGDTITINGHAVIIVYGTVKMAGTAKIQLNTNASLAIFAEGGNVKINCTTTGGITPSASNTLPLAKNFALLSTANPTMGYTVALSQTVPFYGVVYFPYRAITVGTSTVAPTICGSIVGESVTFTNLSAVHYDVALRSPDTTLGDVAFDYIGVSPMPMPGPLAVSGLVASVP